MNRNWTIAAAALATGMAFIDTTALTVALPALRKALSAGDSAMLWIHNAYAVPLAAFLLIGGSLGDRFGIRRVFLTGVGVFGISSVACGLAPDIASLIVLRFFQGVSAALMIPGSLSMIARATPSDSLGRAVGLWSTFTIIATALGPVIGGILVQQGLWRGVFLINAPLAAICLVVARTRTASDPLVAARSTPLDWRGALLLALFLGLLSFALIDRPIFLVAAIPILGGLIQRQRRAEHPLVSPGLFRSRPLVAAILISIFIYSAWGGFTYLLPIYLIDSLRFEPAIAGLLQLPAIAVLAGLSPFAGKLLDRRGPRLPLALGGLISTAGFAALLWPGFSRHPHAILIPLVVLGVGLGFCAGPISATIIRNVPASQYGLAAGINSTVARLASALGVAGLGALAYREKVVDFASLVLAAALTCLVAFSFAFLCPRSTTKDS